jgi:hypothetical protein
VELLKVQWRWDMGCAGWKIMDGGTERTEEVKERGKRPHLTMVRRREAKGGASPAAEWGDDAQGRYRFPIITAFPFVLAGFPTQRLYWYRHSGPWFEWHGQSSRAELGRACTSSSGVRDTGWPLAILVATVVQWHSARGDIKWGSVFPVANPGRPDGAIAHGCWRRTKQVA